MAGRSELHMMDGKLLSLTEWAKLYDMPCKLVYRRIHEHKWTLYRALTEPKHSPTDKRDYSRIPKHEHECKPRRIAYGCKYPDCFHCELPDCYSE